MDLTTVTEYRRATTRDHAALRPGEAFLAGGTWLFSEANRDVTGLVDVTTLPGPSLEVTADGLWIGPGCTIAQLLALPQHSGWLAQPLFAEAADALLASFKVWNEATVIGNIARAYAAGAMLAACATLDATAVIWHADGTESVILVADLPTGNGSTVLAHGDLIRRVFVPREGLRSRATLRKIALSELGRSGAVVSGRVDRFGETMLVVTAATLTPQVLRYPSPPTPRDAMQDVRTLTGYYSDALGAADWRRHVSGVLAAQVVEALA